MNLLSPILEGAEDIEGMITGSDHVGCGPARVSDVRELTALEAVIIRCLFHGLGPILAKVWVLHILGEVGNEELAAVT